MAFPAAFDEENGYLARPPSMTEGQCTPLSVWRGEHNQLPTVVSCWKLTAEELEEINRTGRVWLGICGSTMPPAWVSGCNPFNELPEPKGV